MTPQESILKSVLHVLQNSFGEDLISVVLFGSRARGTNRENSDYDFLFIIDGLASEPVQRLKHVRTALIGITERINTIAHTSHEIESNLTPLLLEICLDGKVIYGSEYFDPLRKKALVALKQSGMVRDRIGREWYWHFPLKTPRHWELSWEGYREFA